MTTKIGIVGAHGKMGTATAALCPEAVLVGSKDSFPDLALQADVWIDFSINTLAHKHIQACEKAGKAILVGTTGPVNTTPSPACPVMFCPNTSIAWNIIRNTLKQLQHMDCLIIDTHHHTKLDAPSGTSKDVASFMKHTKGFCSFRNTINGAKIQLELSDSDEIITITHQSLNRNTYAKGALKIALWLAKQEPGLHTIENFLASKSVEN